MLSRRQNKEHGTVLAHKHLQIRFVIKSYFSYKTKALHSKKNYQ